MQLKPKNKKQERENPSSGLFVWKEMGKKSLRTNQNRQSGYFFLLILTS